MEKKHRARLAFGEKMQLAFHTAMCDACRRYEQQSRLMERLFKSKENAPISSELEEESAVLEEKIIQQLNAQKQ